MHPGADVELPHQEGVVPERKQEQEKDGEEEQTYNYSQEVGGEGAAGSIGGVPSKGRN